MTDYLPLTFKDQASIIARLTAEKAMDQAVRRYPWYDNIWIRRYSAAEYLIERLRPDMLQTFRETFAHLRTRPDFSVVQIDDVLSSENLNFIRGLIREYPQDQLERHEVEGFGRTVVHNHPRLTQLHQQFADLVSAHAGEPVEPTYNFLSLYSDCGLCEPHMDAPKAKWTLDICIDQTRQWPISFSQVVDWPEKIQLNDRSWQEQIKTHPDLEYQSYTLKPGQGLLFSGSSQWHYRDPMPDSQPGDYCHLMFFHFMPSGSKDLVSSRNWSRMFGMPELEILRELEGN